MIEQRLTVTSDEREFKFSFGQGSFKRSLSLREQRGLEDVEERLTAALYPGPWKASRASSEDLKEMGTFLGHLLPSEVREGLESASELVLEAGRTPWELAWWGGRYLWERVALGRSLSRERRGQAKEVPPGLLAVADADGLLPETQERLRPLTACLGEAVRTFHGVKRTQLGKEWGKGYGAAHLCAYETGESLVVQDGLWTPHSPAQRHAVPRFVFLDLACVQGRLLERALEWMTRLADLGVEALVITAWEGQPERMRDLIGSFYNLLQAGRSWGQALRAARLQQLSEVDPYLTAHGFLTYGDPSLSWRDLRPLTIQPADAQTTLRERWACDLVMHVTSGPERGRQIALFFKALRMGSLVIGSSGPRDCDIELEDPELDNQAARFLLEDERLWLVPLTPTLRVNGLPVTDRILLHGDEMIDMGSTSIRLAHPSGAVAARVDDAPERGRYAFDYHGTHLELERPVEVLGRSTECSLVIDDAAVSRRHATVTWRQQAYFVGPVGASKVAVNGVSIDSERALRHGDNIQLSASTVLRFLDLRK